MSGRQKVFLFLTGLIIGYFSGKMVTMLIDRNLANHQAKMEWRLEHEHEWEKYK